MISELTAEQIEHIAVRAAERVMTDVLRWAELALRWPTNCADMAVRIADVARHDADMAEWLDLGANTGYRARAPSADRSPAATRAEAEAETEQRKAAQ